MKKIITTSAVIAVLFTSLQADFDFGDVLKDMKQPETTISKHSKDSTVKLPNADFLFGDVFKDMKKVEFIFGDVFKEMKESRFDFGDVFKDMKNEAQ